MAFKRKKMILEQSANMFFNYGIQHITMDDIAKKCGVSKKTIYKYFENKDDLLHQVIELQIKELKKEIFENKQIKIAENQKNIYTCSNLLDADKLYKNLFYYANAIRFISSALIISYNIWHI